VVGEQRPARRGDATFIMPLLRYQSCASTGGRYPRRPAYGPGADLGQLARQLEYLRHQTTFRERHLVLLSTRDLLDGKGWYRHELAEALAYDGREHDVHGHIMMWDDVLGALTAMRIGTDA
jgi:hypothetical protein